MKITTQQQLDDLIATANKSNTIVLDEDLEITFDCKIPCNIKAHGNITACNIDACNIDAFCIAYKSLKCESIAGARKNSFHKCLDQEIEITKEIKL
jgi:predicted acyltransferase (DUF342 family)